jgi:putative PEP-CTERM system histidine kinase
LGDAAGFPDGLIRTSAMLGEAIGLSATGNALVALLYGGLAVQLWRTGRLAWTGERTGRLFAAAVLVTAGWGLTSLVDLWSAKRLTWHLTVGLDHLRYLCWSGFLLLLLQPATQGDARAGRRVGWLLAAALALGSAVVNLLVGVFPPDWPRAAPLLAAAGLGWAVFCLLLLEQVFRNQVDAARWAAKPLGLALAGTFVFDIYLYAQALMLGALDGDALGARGLVHGMAMPLLLVASRRQAQWLDRLMVSKSAAFYSATLLLVGLYLLFVSAAGYYVRYAGGSWGGALQVSLVFAALVLLSMLVLSGEMRARLRVFLGKNFFRYRYDYRVEWLRFTAMLSTKTGPQEVGELVIRGLADMVESPGGGLWFKALGDERYVQAARWNMPAMADAVAPDDALCHFLRDRDWIFDLDPARQQRDAEAEAVLPPWLSALPSGWAAVPLNVADALIGFVVLLQPRARFDLNWEVRDLLKTAARQAAGFLAQMHAAEALLEARKFDAFNRMSAFVVHDLKNIVTQLSLMLKNAQRHHDNPEFQQDMLATVESSLDKMRQMMLQLREGTRPAGPTSGVDLPAVLQRIEAAVQQRGRAIAVEVVDRVATRGHEDRLERVLGHVVQNSLEATPLTGRVWIRLQQVAGRAVLEVGDTGVGMSPEFVQNRLFRPFNSTKAAGMGIGTYESFQYLKELGGSIDVKSEVGKGTVVTLHLPLFDMRTVSDLQQSRGRA